MNVKGMIKSVLGAALVLALPMEAGAQQRVARASSAYDYNLTAQLAVDGIVDDREPAWLEVWADDRVLPKREREWAIGGNSWCNNVCYKSLRYRWHGMAVKADEVRMLCYVQHGEGVTCRQSAVTLRAGNRQWQTRFDGLPGEPYGNSQHSDPNKRIEGKRWPTRRVEATFSLGGERTIDDLQLLFDMKGAECWRVNEIRFFRRGEEVTDVLPSHRFCSVWMSADEPTRHHEMTVEMGAGTRVDSVRPIWVTGWEPKHCDWTFKNGRLRLTMDGRERVAMRELKIYPERKAAREAKGEGLRWQVARGCGTAEGFDPTRAQWMEAVVPGSVLTSYIEAKAVPDPNFDDDMTQISESYFLSDFWYRTTFKRTSMEQVAGRTMLNLDGINWIAEVTLNGRRIGEVRGAFRRGRFDITDCLREDNELLIRILPNAHPGAVKEKSADETDFNGGALAADSPTFLCNVGWDWISTVRGRNIGLWGDVRITQESEVTLMDPLVTTVLDDSLRASMRASVRVANNTGRGVIGTLTGTIGDITFARRISIAGSDTIEVSFAPEDYPQLRAQRMRLWNPNGMGEPYLYDASFAFQIQTTANTSKQFQTTSNNPKQNQPKISYLAGIREVTYAETDTRLQLFVNHRRVNPMGGNWGFPEHNLRYTAADYDTAVRLHREMGFNMIRNWVGQTPHRAFYEACDRHGILVWQDFWLANPADGPDPTDERMFMDNARDYVYRIRQHPSIALYCGRNEGFPPASLDSALRRCVAKEHPRMLYIPSSADGGVSGHGPYWAVPRQEYFARQTGKLHTERGMPNVMGIESLRRTLREEHLWPQGDAWGGHDYCQKGAQRGATFNALVGNYGEATDAESFCRWAQWQNYEGHRAMYEANNVGRQGLLMWMSHPCWPSMTWQTYDYFFDRGAAFYAIRKACEPTHIQFDSQRLHVQVVGQPECREGRYEAQAQVIDKNGTVERQWSQPIDLRADSTMDVIGGLALPTDSATHFLRLRLTDEEGRTASDNTYLYNARGDDYKDLTSNAVDTKIEMTVEGNTVRLRNRADRPALMVHLRLMDKDGKPVQATFSDNYFHLMPHEERTITCSAISETAGCRVQIIN